LSKEEQRQRLLAQIGLKEGKKLEVFSPGGFKRKSVNDGMNTKTVTKMP